MPWDPPLRRQALESLVLEKGLFDPEALDAPVAAFAPVTLAGR